MKESNLFNELVAPNLRLFAIALTLREIREKLGPKWWKEYLETVNADLKKNSFPPAEKLLEWADDFFADPKSWWSPFFPKQQ